MSTESCSQISYEANSYIKLAFIACYAALNNTFSGCENENILLLVPLNTIHQANFLKNQKFKHKKAIMTSLTAHFGRRIVLANGPLTEKIKEQHFGVTLSNGSVQLSLPEAAFLLDQKTISVVDARGKPLTLAQFELKANRFESDFWIRAAVLADLRTRGYIVKPGLKFGADFAVYDRGIKPGDDHAVWLVFPVHEGEKFNWRDFAAKNRVAHTTKKRLMVAVVDDERSVTYFEIKWTRP